MNNDPPILGGSLGIRCSWDQNLMAENGKNLKLGNYIGLQKMWGAQNASAHCFIHSVDSGEHRHWDLALQKPRCWPLMFGWDTTAQTRPIWETESEVTALSVWLLSICFSFFLLRPCGNQMQLVGRHRSRFRR